MRRTTELLAGIALLAACGGDPIANRTTATEPGTTANQTSVASLPKELDPLRKLTAPFREFEKAKAAGWSTQITPCLTDAAGAGAMGLHYGNTTLIDGSVKVDEPELLLYEPQPSGALRLVAVEYIVPVSAWTDPNPPRLYGRDFHVIAAFQVWALHVWLWKSNPSGMFQDWNPNVTCAAAS
jgi:hypothetical protein